MNKKYVNIELETLLDVYHYLIELNMRYRDEFKMADFNNSNKVVLKYLNSKQIELVKTQEKVIKAMGVSLND